MGTFGKGNSGSQQFSTVDEVRDKRANSANHNQSNADYCYRWRGMVRVSVCVYVMEIITAKTAEPIKMSFGSDCPA